MAETVYEGMFLLDSGRYARDPDGVADQIPNMIQEAGGQMLVSRLWEERRLAYPIKGHRKGTYWLTYFRVAGEKLAQINRKCHLSDSVLRVLFLKIDPRIADTLVEYARTGQLKAGSEAAVDKPPRGVKEPTEKEAAVAGKKDAAAAKEDAAAGKEDAAAGKEDAAAGKEAAAAGKEAAVAGKKDAVPGKEDAVAGKEDAVAGKEDVGQPTSGDAEP